MSAKYKRKVASKTNTTDFPTLLPIFLLAAQNCAVMIAPARGQSAMQVKATATKALWESL